jgi:hypothetical protein
VFVSIVCWTNQPQTEELEFRLDGKVVQGITPSLKSGTHHRVAVKLKPNQGIVYVGFFPNGMGFVLDDAEAKTTIAASDADYSKVIFPFMTGADTVQNPSQSAVRYVIDFGDMTLEEASKYPRALSIVRERVKPIRDEIARKAQRERWWQFEGKRAGLTREMSRLSRLAVGSQVGKRIMLIWSDNQTRPSHTCNVFAFDDGYHFGVCSSAIHDVWVRANSSTLKGDLRYTPSTAFETFPFPSPNRKQSERIAVTSQMIVELRQQACEQLGKGLTKVYNLMDDGGFVELKRAHRELDLAVADAYGWDAAMLDDPVRLLDALFDLNAQCATDPNYAPFGRTDDVPTLLDLSEEDVL